MIEIPVYRADGQQAGSVELDPALLGGEVRPTLLKQAYVMYHANRRQGSATTRSRGMVVGSTRKLYRQKGTGRARMGTVRTAIRRGGGVAFAKSPKSWRQAMPVKMRRLAGRNAVLSKAVDGELKIVEAFDFKAPKTKAFASVLDALSIDRTCLFAVAEGEGSQNAILSARNLTDVTITRVHQLNAYDLLSHRYLLMDKATFEAYLESVAKPVREVEAGEMAEEAA